MHDVMSLPDATSYHNLINSNWCSRYQIFFAVASSADPEMASPFATSHPGSIPFLIAQFWGLYAADKTCTCTNTTFTDQGPKLQCLLKIKEDLYKLRIDFQDAKNNVSN